MMSARVRSFLDSNLNKFISRKLLVLILGTFLLCLGLITADLWVGLASTYVGVEGLKDGLVAWHSAKAEATNKVKNNTPEVSMEGKDNNA